MAKKGEIKQLQEALTNMENELKRALADYRNLERRVQEDAMSVAQYSKAQLVLKILVVLDSLDQAVAGASESEADSAWLKGVLMSIKQLRQVLSDEGLVEIEASGKFNPQFHEAVDVHEGEDDKILEVVQRGYTLNEKVIRPARVVVGKSQPEKMSEEGKKEVEMEEV